MLRAHCGASSSELGLGLDTGLGLGVGLDAGLGLGVGFGARLGLGIGFDVGLGLGHKKLRRTGYCIKTRGGEPLGSA